MENIDHIIFQRLKSHPDFQKTETVWLSVYRKHQCYGGCEEGGWWYDVYQLEGSIPFLTEQDALDVLQVAKDEIEDINKLEAPYRHSSMANLPDEDTAYHDEGYIPVGWDDGGKLLVTIEKVKGELDNTKEGRPHYE
jgi:hypothetical protein